jgi:hypothetical protein
MSRRLVVLLAALSSLALSAGLVLAARPAAVPPAAATPGLTRASDAAGKTVPVVTTVGAPTTHDADPDEDTQDESAPDQDAKETETGEAPTSDADRPQNHGWFVSQAAQAETPAGTTHGAAVSAVAKSTAGKPAGSTTAEAASSHGKSTSAAAKAKHQH